MKQSIIFTCLPNRIDEENKLHFSVHVSLRLENATSTTMASFPDMANWVKKIKNAEFSIQLGNGKEYAVDLNKSKLNEDLWLKLLHKNIRVDGFQQEDLSVSRIHSYPIKHVQSFLLDTYKKLGIQNPDHLIDPAVLRDPNGLGQISKFKKRETAKQKPQTSTNAKNPVFMESDFLDVDDSTDKQLNAIRRKKGFIPFGKTPEPRSDFAQFQDFHKTYKPTRTTPLLKIKKPEFEFHDIMAVCSNYTQIQRKLAVVLDFTFDPPNNLPKQNSFRLLVKNVDFSTATQVSVPLSAYRLTADGFYANTKQAGKINMGFVKINTDDFTAFQIDTDGVALKVNQMVDNKIQEAVKLKVVQVDLGRSKKFSNGVVPQDPPEKEGLPTLRSSGIGIARNGMGEHLYSRFVQAKQLQSKIIDPSKLDPDLKLILSNEILYADDLVQGYRMDVAYNSEPENWYSLHRRKESYSYFDSDNVEEVIDDIEEDEGFIQTATAEDTEDENELFVGENMIRWEGWSLSVQKPGFAINESEDDSLEEGKRVDYVNTSKNIEAKKYQFDSSREFRLHAKSEIVKGSLPRLRFGWDYMLRVRTVDLAGNSVSIKKQAENTNEAVIRSFPYYRFDALMTPVLLLGSEIKDGEALEELVIRSNFDSTTEEFQQKYSNIDSSENTKSIRHLLPPRNSQLIAEQHSKYDKAFGTSPAEAKEMYQLISSHEVQLEKGENGKEKVYTSENVDLIYLPDPAAAGVALFLADAYDHTHSQKFDPRLFSFFTNEELSPDETNYSPAEEDWYKAKSLRIKLIEGETAFTWNSSERMLIISLPKGERIKLKFSTFWRAGELKELSGMWHLLEEENPDNLNQIRKLAEAGKHWMISPARELEVTHAVLQPVEAPQIKEIIPDRDYQETFSLLNTKFSVHGYSTHKIEYKARWKDRVDDPRTTEPGWKENSGNLEELAINYHDVELTKGSIPEEKDSEKKLKAEPNKSQQMKIKKQEQAHITLRKIEENTMRSLEIKKQDFFTPLKGMAMQVMWPALKHKFGDTKHRYVDYHPEGTSRYTEQFDKIAKAEELQFTSDGKWFERVNILSSDRPKAPIIDYIMPTFEWRKTKIDMVMRQHRLGGGLRIYLKRPWFSTGEDEMIGILLSANDPSKTVSILSLDGSGKFNTMMTHWAIDPIRPSKLAAKNQPALTDFRHNPIIDKSIVYPGFEKTKVNVVAYPVEFDMDRKLWYADLAINHAKMYFPFVKLALARYQAHSVRKNNTDVCLSPVVMADYVQLVPERTATLTFKKDNMNSRFTLQIEGVISNKLDRNGNTGNYLQISFVDPQLVQPVYGMVSDGRNEESLEEKGVRIPISGKDVVNNYYTISRGFKLSRKYKNQALHVVIQEFEGSPPATAGSTHLANLSEENEPRMVYADVFKINAPNRDKI